MTRKQTRRLKVIFSSSLSKEICTETKNPISLKQNYGISTTAGGGVLGRLRSSTPSPSSSTTRRSRGVLELGRGVLEPKLHKEESKYTEA